MKSELSGMRILIVEDEYFLAADLADALCAAGAAVIGPAGTLEDAGRALDGRIDAVLLDVNLRGELAWPVARRLRERGIPFLLATGYGADSVPDELADAPRIEKPYEAKKAVRRLAGLIGGRSAG